MGNPTDSNLCHYWVMVQHPLANSSLSYYVQRQALEPALVDCRFTLSGDNCSPDASHVPRGNATAHTAQSWSHSTVIIPEQIGFTGDAIRW